MVLNLHTGVNTLTILYRTPSKGSAKNSLLTVTLDNLYKEYEICNDCGEMRKTSEFYQYSRQVLTLLDNDIAYNDGNDQIKLSFNKNYNDTTQTIIVSK